MTDIERLKGRVLQNKEDGTKYVAEGVEGNDLIIGRLGDRRLAECPVECGDECIDPDCDGGIGETERDPETMSAHELYCYGCGLNWVEYGSTWGESYVDWPTSFSFEENETADCSDTGSDRDE